MFDATTITVPVFERLRSHTARLHRQLGLTTWDALPDAHAASPLHADLALLVRIANSELDRQRADPELVGEVVACVQRVIDILFTPPFGKTVATLPEAIWLQPGIGQLLAHVHAWLRQDDLIGLTDAAHLLFADLAARNLQAARMRVKRLIARGALMAYLDPSEANPTRQTRVSRQVVEALREHGVPLERS
jgi:hypothetical protein